MPRTRKQSRVIVPQPDRVRRIGPSGFGWIDARLHRDGWLEVLTPTEVAVYAVLCLVADRQGVSWYRHGTLSAMLAIPPDELSFALRRLCELDLLAYQPFRSNAEDGFHQVLSVPADGPREPSSAAETSGTSDPDLIQPLPWR